MGFSAQRSPNGGDKQEDGAKPLRQPREGRQPKPIRQAENEIPVFALFASLANMDPRAMSELIAKKKKIRVAFQVVVAFVGGGAAGVCSVAD